MDKDRFVISDDLWKKIAPLLPGKAGAVRVSPSVVSSASLTSGSKSAII